MNTKTVRAGLTLKETGAPGAVSAVFSTFGVVDGDNDIVLATALTHGQAVPMTWAHNWAMPVGKGLVQVQPEQAVFEGAFFLDTDAGLEAYKTVKAMGPLQEWSWGFRVIDAGYEQRDEKFVRVIKRAEVFEVSPVLVGAGVGTYTVGIKSGDGHMALADQGDAVLAAATDLAGRLRALAALRAKEGRVLSDANRKRLAALSEALRTVLTDVDELLRSTEPEKGLDPMTLYVEFQRITNQLRG